MIRTLCTLAPGTKLDGTRCLKGELHRALTTRDDQGNERTYPAGTQLVLTKNHTSGTYSLLAMLQDDQETFRQFEAERQRLAGQPEVSHW